MLGRFTRYFRQIRKREDAIPAQPADPFACVWDDDSLAHQRRLLGRISEVAERTDTQLYLFWGTLLGHVREGGILPWDDDVDLAMVGLDAKAQASFRAALHEIGLETHDLNPGERIIKVCDPTYPHQTGYPWTWPFVDIFPYARQPGVEMAGCDPLPVSEDLVLPGRETVFEGARFWEPHDPNAVLDKLYSGWRTTEASPTWNHRQEQERPGVGFRSIRTDPSGRKIK